MRRSVSIRERGNDYGEYERSACGAGWHRRRGQRGGARTGATGEAGARGQPHGARASCPPGVENFTADASTAAGARLACADAAVVYCCTNPAYDKWAEQFPELLDAAIAGAASAGAKLVMADNLYIYPPTSQPLTEDMPWQPTTRKGRVRVAMDETLLAAHRSGTVRATMGRASNYYGPNAPASFVGEMFFGQVLGGKAVQWPGRIDLPHTLSYIDDFAAGVGDAGRARRGAGAQGWHIPVAEPLTATQYVALAAEIAGTRAHATAISPLMMRAVGFFVMPVRESIEMSYEYNEPYLLDASKFTRAFGFTPTSHRAALEPTIAWYRAHAAKK